MKFLMMNVFWIFILVWLLQNPRDNLVSNLKIRSTVKKLYSFKTFFYNSFTESKKKKDGKAIIDSWGKRNNLPEKILQIA